MAQVRVGPCLTSYIVEIIHLETDRQTGAALTAQQELELTGLTGEWRRKRINQVQFYF